MKSCAFNVSNFHPNILCILCTYNIFWINLHCRIMGKHMFEYIALFLEPFMASWHNIMKCEWIEGEFKAVQCTYQFLIFIEFAFKANIRVLIYDTKIIWFPVQIVIVWHCIVYIIIYCWELTILLSNFYYIYLNILLLKKYYQKTAVINAHCTYIVILVIHIIHMYCEICSCLSKEAQNVYYNMEQIKYNEIL